MARRKGVPASFQTQSSPQLLQAAARSQLTGLVEDRAVTVGGNPE